MRKLLGLAVVVGLIVWGYATYWDVNWEEYSSRQGGYTVTFPATPFEKTARYEGANGTLVVHHAGVHVVMRPLGIPWSDRSYVVEYADFPDRGTAWTALEFLTDNPPGLQEIGGSRKLLTKLDIAQGEMRGREVRLESAEKLFTTRGYVRGTRVYLVVIAQQRFDLGADHSQRFLESFEVQQP